MTRALFVVLGLTLTVAVCSTDNRDITDPVSGLPAATIAQANSDAAQAALAKEKETTKGVAESPAAQQEALQLARAARAQRFDKDMYELHQLQQSGVRGEVLHALQEAILQRQLNGRIMEGYPRRLAMVEMEAKRAKLADPTLDGHALLEALNAQLGAEIFGEILQGIERSREDLREMQRKREGIH